MNERPNLQSSISNFNKIAYRNMRVGDTTMQFYK